jgi:hypothetical protein
MLFRDKYYMPVPAVLQMSRSSYFKDLLRIPGKHQVKVNMTLHAGPGFLTTFFDVYQLCLKVVMKKYIMIMNK